MYQNKNKQKNKPQMSVPYIAMANNKKNGQDMFCAAEKSFWLVPRTLLSFPSSFNICIVFI
jgi:hypothetical protein